MDTVEMVRSGRGPRPRPGVLRRLVRPERVPVATTVLGLLVFLASQVLPWMTVTPRSGEGPARDSESASVDAFTKIRSLGFADIGSWPTYMYLTGWVALLAVAGAAITAEGRSRRMLTAAGLGIVGFQVVDVIGVANSLHSGGTAFGAIRQVFGAGTTGPEYGLGSGVWAALAAPLVVGAALLLSMKQSGGAAGSPADDEADPADEAAAQDDVYWMPDDSDLQITVTPVKPFETDRR